jgi:hypothetical protein
LLGEATSKRGEGTGHSDMTSWTLSVMTSWTHLVRDVMEITFGNRGALAAAAGAFGMRAGTVQSDLSAFWGKPFSRVQVAYALFKERGPG